MEFVSDNPVIEEEHIEHWVIPPVPEWKNKVIEEVIGHLSQRVALSASMLFRYRLCLDEALTNAITHGCPQGEQLPVEVDFYWCPGSWAVRVVDQGPGFRAEDLPDPDAPGAELAEGGRGVLILQRFTESLTYAQGGREVVLRMSSKEGDD